MPIRTTIAAVLAALVGLLIPAAVATQQLHDQVFQTDRFVAAADLAVEDPTARHALSAIVANRAARAAKCSTKSLAGQLVIGAIAAGLESRVTEAVDSALATPRVQGAWSETVGATHRNFTEALIAQGDDARLLLDLSFGFDAAGNMLEARGGGRVDPENAGPAGGDCAKLAAQHGSLQLVTGHAAHTFASVLRRLRDLYRLPGILALVASLLTIAALGTGVRDLRSLLRLFGIAGVGAVVSSLILIGVAGNLPTTLSHTARDPNVRDLIAVLTNRVLAPIHLTLVVMLCGSAIVAVAGLFGSRRR